MPNPVNNADEDKTKTPNCKDIIGSPNSPSTVGGDILCSLDGRSSENRHHETGVVSSDNSSTGSLGVQSAIGGHPSGTTKAPIHYNKEAFTNLLNIISVHWNEAKLSSKSVVQKKGELTNIIEIAKEELDKKGADVKNKY